MAIAVSLICMTITMVMVQNGNAAPLISKDQDQNVNSTNSIEVSEGTDTNELPLFENAGLFEGDIKISAVDIRKYYNLSSMPHSMLIDDEEISNHTNVNGQKIEKRAATSDDNILWPNAIVPYQFAASISRDLRHRIRDAMDHWENNTCLRFVEQDGELDYVNYKNLENACWSFIGRQGGSQTINIFRGCQYGSVVHEIGHAIGFWHEQSRPDRDDYVNINLDNLIEGEDVASNFMKLRDDEVNSRGSEYDYGSVMHYPTTAFVREDCIGCQSIEVTNDDAYRRQGNPIIGQRNGLSLGDIVQANSLYNCPKIGVSGQLIVQIKSGQFLGEVNDIGNNLDRVGDTPDAYVKVTALDSFGVIHERTTSVKLNTRDPIWNEHLEFPDREWQFFRIQVWDRDEFTGTDEKLSVSQTIVLTVGQLLPEHETEIHCIDNKCIDSVLFGYDLYAKASLTLHMRYAFHLKTIGSPPRDPNPYVSAKVESTEGPYIQTTNVEYDRTFPLWYTNLNFGCRKWSRHIDLQILHSNSGGQDTALSAEEIVKITPTNSIHLQWSTANQHNAYGNGFLIYDYKFLIDGNECSSNPCQNGGTCVDGCASYTCLCRPHYRGTNCGFRYANLRIFARYGRDLPDRDPVRNLSDPYMEVIAFDEAGNSYRKRTREKSGDQNPDWYEWLDFGASSWIQFNVQLYDDDDNADDPLSPILYVPLSSYGRYSVVVNANNHGRGYAILDFIYD